MKDRVNVLEDKFEKMAETLEEFKNENEFLRKTIHPLEIKLLGKEKNNEIGNHGQDDDCEERKVTRRMNGQMIPLRKQKLYKKMYRKFCTGKKYEG